MTEHSVNARCWHSSPARTITPGRWPWHTREKAGKATACRAGRFRRAAPACARRPGRAGRRAALLDALRLRPGRHGHRAAAAAEQPGTWPVFPGNAAIESGLAPEQDATLQIYNWVAYINQAVVNTFAKKYKCKVQVTTFNTMDEALSKLRSGLSYDLLIGATVDVLGQLIEAQLVQPLNHSYIPNITQAWPDYTNPFYDQGWQYTVPYTIYTTGSPGVRTWWTRTRTR